MFKKLFFVFVARVAGSFQVKRQAQERRHWPPSNGNEKALFSEQDFLDSDENFQDRRRECYGYWKLKMLRPLSSQPSSFRALPRITTTGRTCKTYNH